MEGLAAARERLGAAEAEHYFAVRESLEALAAELATRNATPAGLRGLERILARTRKAAEAGRLRETVGLNADFHRAIVELSGNPLLQDMMAPLDGRLRRLFRLTSGPESTSPMCTEQEQLLAAIAPATRRPPPTWPGSTSRAPGRSPWRCWGAATPDRHPSHLSW
ncbi:FCD domain-containing protein [Kitasatospora sp. NPDC085879]|uniref:GntR family transcriptional regulator n=1 Tax=Kitasatospora sp. NPDC085879 TaxID=3154769 RepID=UPI0034121955